MPKIYLSKADQDKNKILHADKFIVIANFLTKSGDSDDYGKNGKNDGDGDEPDVEAKADLDTPTENKGNHTVVPPYNKEASPETDPSKDVPNYVPPTKDESRPASADFDMEDEGDCKACAYISEEERQKVPDEDCAGPAGTKSFPIRGGKDVQSASRLVGHSPNPSQTKKRIIEIAKRKGLDKYLPASWKSPDRQTAYDQTLELFGKLSAEEKKSLADKLDWQEQAVKGPQEANI